MTEVTNQKLKPSTSIVLISSEAIANKLLGAEIAKGIIKEKAKICADIQITDDSSRQIAVQLLTELNKTLGLLEEKRVEVKQRPLNECKFIDTVAKYVKGEADKVILAGKEKIRVYDNAKVETQQKQIAQVKEDAEEATIVAEMTAEKKFSAIDCIRKWWIESFDKMNNSSSLNELKERYLVHSWNKETKFPMPQFYDLPEAANELKRRIIFLKDILKGVIDLRVKFAGENDEEKALELQEQILSQQRIVINFKKESAKYFDDMHAAILTEKEETENNIKADVVAIEVAATTDKMPAFEYDYELVDFAKVPDELKMINSKAVEAYIKKNQSRLANGMVQDGLRFIRTVKKVTLR